MQSDDLQIARGYAKAEDATAPVVVRIKVTTDNGDTLIARDVMD